MIMARARYYFLWLSLIIIGIFVIQNLPGIPGFTDLFVLNDKANNGEVWRFVTSIFLHGSISHLLYNLFALLFFGVILEKLIGSKRFLLTFFVTGIIANIIAVNYYSSSLGASGAIYGIIGALAIVRPFMMVFGFGFMVPMFIAAILWVAGDVMRLMGVFGQTNIGSIAHISGIVVGLLFGLYFLIGKKDVRKEKKVKLEFNEDNFRKWEDSFVKR